MINKRAGKRAAIWVAMAFTALGCDCGPELISVAPKIEVTPNPVAFGKVAVGSAAEQVVEIDNLGSGYLKIDSITVTEGSAEIGVTRLLTTDCSGNARTGDLLSLAGGSCARFAVRVKPLETHEVKGVISIVSDASNEPELLVPVTAQGVVAGVRACVLTAQGELDEAACTDFSTDPATIPSIDFGEVPLRESRLRQVRVFNLGEGSLVLTNVRVQSSVPDFSVPDGSFNGTVEAGKSIDIDVTFTPAGSGEMTGLLLLPSNDPAHPVVELPIFAMGLGAGLCFNPEVGLDFGAVAIGESRTLTLQMENCGHVDYKINQLVFSENDPTTLEYALRWLTIDGQPAAAPQTPLQFPPGSQLFAEVTYTPRRVHSAAEVGDKAGFAVRTEFQSGVIPVIGKGNAPECTGIVPTARIRVLSGTTDISANPVSEPLRSLTFDGSGSTVPSGGAQYLWRLVRQPQGGTQGLTGSLAARRNLFLELAGEYEVELIVQDQFGCQSPAVTAVVRSIPNATLHVQLTWPESHGDVDLHMTGPGGSLFDTGTFTRSAGDCYYMTCKDSSLYGPVDWSSNSLNPDGNANNNPTLDIDTLWGKGPENINIKSPADGVYKVVSHYYCSRSGTSNVSRGKATATLKIYVNGQQTFSAQKEVYQRDLWEGAVITVSNNGTNIVVSPSTAAVTHASGSESCSSATD